MTSPAPGAFLILAVPEAEPAVARQRARLDPSAAEGVPAHITVLGPLMAPAAIDASVLAELQRLFAEISGFAFRLERTDWFGDNVLWLAPCDPGPFRALTQRAHAACPDFPPFGGRHEVVVPHLTIGHGHPVSDLRAAEAAVQPYLPIDAYAAAVTLITAHSAAGHDGQWAQLATFPLRSS